MFTRKWDLDEDLLITRTNDGVAVSGTASSGDRAASMQATLSGLPNVQISITAPAADDRPTASNRSVPGKSAPASSTPLLKDAFDRAFASPSSGANLWTVVSPPPILSFHMPGRLRS